MPIVFDEDSSIMVWIGQMFTKNLNIRIQKSFNYCCNVLYDRNLNQILAWHTVTMRSSCCIVHDMKCNVSLRAPF
ncbi:hypothetical protein DERF_005832 [Dermatophagoides farinae]|uniref:Uncharacterized protein n=1 Tax=Dermatophagoides farinae TaxID=6954 RepID=A0A922I519_DERFA|nr:hypothetical protein DERF_005832 [Dermatophagoides farinae]